MKTFFFTLTLTALLAFASAAIAEELVTLQTREGVTQSFLLTVPADSKPVAAAILFPGGEGHIRLRNEGGQIKLATGNFLVRSRQLFVRSGIVTAVVDTPSDQPRGMDDWFRLGDKHAADIRRVSEELRRRFPGTPVFLVGTSRGTISAAATGRALGETVAGVVLTSTLFVGGGRPGPGLSGFDFTAIRAPLLFVHHIEDGCKYTPYRDAQNLSPQFALITVRGGDPARSDPCEAFSAHGYLGKETETVEAMVNWMLKKPYRAEID
jgi:pimeloyl-ACP methyl ester carboxylesterase